MDFFDNAVNKAKEAIDIACKKTNEVVSTGKQKFDVASIEAKRTKDFEQLGMLYFDMVKDTDIDNETVRLLVEEIKAKNEKIKELNTEINNTKNKRVCPACGASIDKYSVFCSVCGAKLEIGSDENE